MQKAAIDNPTKTQQPSQRMVSLEDHRRLLRDVFQTAKERILIVSPAISGPKMRQDNVVGLAFKTVRRGVKVDIFTDIDLNRRDGQLNRATVDGVTDLRWAGATVTFLDGIHNKSLIRDNDLIAEGSFNWLSASRTEGGPHQREERTTVIYDDDARRLIETETLYLKRPAKEPKAEPAQAVQPARAMAQGRGNGRASADLDVKGWDPSSASPGKATRVLGWVAGYSLLSV